MTAGPEYSKPKYNSEVDVSVLSKDWPDIQSMLVDVINLTLAEAGLAQENFEISLVLANNDFIQELNKNYRGKDKPTNVLSFPQDDDLMLGDIIMAYETVAVEAQEQGKSFEDHASHLAIHGILHLLGHDHEDEAEAEEMEMIEVAVLRKLGIKNPYET